MIPTPSAEVVYLLLVFGLFVVPKMLQRFRLPSAVTSVILGAVVGLATQSFADDPTIKLFSTLGIVALFLFAGLEVDFVELKQARQVLIEHVVIQLGLLALVTGLLAATFIPSTRVALLVALAVVTPSTGFILDSLAQFGLTSREQFWVKSKAVATEIVALVVLFVALQSQTAVQLVTASVALIALILVVPLLFRFFAAFILPYAPKSEFAFLVIVALICAFATRSLGVYYLVGAFVVGVAAQRFRRKLPSLTSDSMLRSVEVFASFFVPFYFFGAGLSLSAGDLSFAAVLAAIALLGVVQPLRLLSVALHRRLSLRENWTATMRVATPLLPTLVFTLVLAEIINERYAAPSWTFAALTLYAVIGTMIPGFSLGAAVADPDLIEPDTGALPGEPLHMPPGTEPGPAEPGYEPPSANDVGASALAVAAPPAPPSAPVAEERPQ